MEYNNDYNYQENNVVENEKRPSGLTVLCILTFIGSGFSLLAYFFSFSLYDTIQEMMLAMAETVGGMLAETYENTANIFINTPKMFFLLMMLPALFSIVGSTFMLNMRRLGFHMYVVGQILVLGFPMLLLKSGFNVGGLLFSLLFIALYAIFFKKMK
ncbi:MAG: hypothetical protein FWH36_06450 [Lentimicrobiaceae bacterium]|nr:hypothetical protein [Lentimicrobiaceae bacterium]